MTILFIMLLLMLLLLLLMLWLLVLLVLLILMLLGSFIPHNDTSLSHLEGVTVDSVIKEIVVTMREWEGWVLSTLQE